MMRWHGFHLVSRLACVQWTGLLLVGHRIVRVLASELCQVRSM
jgi:hypothetical protein